MKELRVVSGFHRGVSLILDEDPIIIGASVDADLMLSDPGVVESHVKVERKGKDGWQLSCLKGGAKDRYGNKVKTADISMGDMFNISDVWIQFADKKSPWPSSEMVCYEIPKENKKEKEAVVSDSDEDDSEKDSKKENKKFLMYKIVVASVIGFIGVLTATHATVSDKNAGEDSFKEVVENEFDKERRSREKIENLSAIFNKMLKERDLTEVDLLASSNVWNVEGALDPEDIQKLKRMIIRFSKRNPHELIINNNVVEKSYSLPFEIVKVISGPYGHVQASDGHKLYLGSEYKGVTLVSITKNELIFSGENNITVNW